MAQSRDSTESSGNLCQATKRTIGPFEVPIRNTGWAFITDLMMYPYIGRVDKAFGTVLKALKALQFAGFLEKWLRS